MAHGELDLLLAAAKRLAATMLENGGETYRAEEAVSRLCGLYGVQEVEALALPTGVLIHITAQDGAQTSGLVRVRSRRLDLGALAQANEISRRLAGGALTAKDACTALDALRRGNGKRARLTAPAVSAFSIGCFAVLMGGGALEFGLSALCAFLSQFVCAFFQDEDMFYFISSFIGGAVCALTAVLSTALCGAGNIGIIISASILPLLPGMTLIGAIRDSMRGDLVSGAARLGDVIVVALSLAFGVGAVLWLYGLTGGVL